MSDTHDVRHEDILPQLERKHRFHSRVPIEQLSARLFTAGSPHSAVVRVTISSNCLPRRMNWLPASCVFCGPFSSGAWLRWPGQSSGRQSQQYSKKPWFIVKMTVKRLIAVGFRYALCQNSFYDKVLEFRWWEIYCTAGTSCTQVVQCLHSVYYMTFLLWCSFVLIDCHPKWISCITKCVCLNHFS